MHVPSRHTRPQSIPAVLLAGMALGMALLLAAPVHATVIGSPVPKGSPALPFLMWSAGANNGFGGYIPVASLPASALGSQSANTHLAGPASGAAASPTFRALVPLDIPSALAGTGLTSTAGVLSVTTPAVAPAGAYYVSHANAGATAYVSDSALQNNGAQIGVGIAPTTTDRVSVNPSAAAENGLTVTMPSGASGYGWRVRNSTGGLLAWVDANGYYYGSGGIRLYSDTSLIFRGIASGGWTDSATAAFFQLGQTNGLFTAINGGVLGRFAVTSGFSSLTDAAYTSIAVPTGLLDLTTVSTSKPMLAIHLPASSAQDAIEVSSSGGTAGDRFKATSAGVVSAASSFTAPTINATTGFQANGVAGYTGTIPLTATGLHLSEGIIVGYYTGGTTSAPAAPLVGN